MSRLLTLDTFVPQLKVEGLTNNAALIKFLKSNFDAIHLEWKLADAAEWTFAGIYTVSPVLHSLTSATAPAPHVRQYRAIMLKNNAPTGNYSPIISVVALP